MDYFGLQERLYAQKRILENQATEQYYLNMAQLGELFWYDEKRFLEIYQPKGFKREWMLKPITELSGGELTKVRIIKLFFENNDLIILDEPSNHLDQDNFNWLIKYLLKENQSARSE
ncbi:MAG: ATP-binding cassette domain-containing protein, partial [Neisseriaceae bacterium]|nr:ATP-binding cassette domain-containing protein [Neisseriaceae bacterium]